MRGLVHDLRYALRVLARSPGYALAATVTLALGIGPNTAIFAALNEMLLRPVPHVGAPGRLVQLHRFESTRGTLGFSHLGYLDYRDHNSVLTGLMAFRGADLDLAAAGRPERVEGLLVTGNYFAVLNMRAALGRLIDPQDDLAAGAHAVAVISHSLWQRRFGGDRRLVRRAVLLNGFRYTIVGVAPPLFRGTEWGAKVDVWLPLGMERQVRPAFEVLHSRLFAVLGVVGRLKPGIGVEKAQAEFAALATRFEEPVQGSKARVIVAPGTRLNPEWRRYAVGFLSVLLATVSLVLAVACANVANLTLAHAARRSREVAIRLALGAGRGRLIRLFLAESLVVAVAAGGLGIVIGYWLGALLASRYVDVVPESIFRLDPVVLAYALTISLATGIAFGVAPALGANRPDLAGALKGAAASAATRRFRLRDVLVVAQVGISLLAIVTAALFVRTLHNLRLVHPGYDLDGLFSAQLTLRPAGYSEIRGRQFYRDLVERTAALPGVRSVTLASSLPPGWMWGGQLELQDRPLRAGERPIQVGKNMVGPGYFETLHAPLLAGRGIAAGDTEKSPPVAVVNETMARMFWHGENPIGKRFRWVGGLGARLWIEVVGVARDGKYEHLAERPQPHVCVPFAQAYEPEMKLVVRAAGNVRAVMAAVRNDILTFDRNLPVVQVRTAREHLAESLLNERLNATIISFSGLLALLLSGLGLYSVVSYSVAQRTHEIGIRISLGASRAQVLRPLMLEGLRLSALGLAVGALATLVATRLVASELYGVGAADPASFLAAAALLAAIMLVACWIPARRALRIDPVRALRHE